MAPEGPEATTAREQDFVLFQGLRDTRGALERWAAAPSQVLGGWFTGAVLVAIGLLTATWLISLISTPDPTPAFIPGVTWPVEGADLVHILGRNLLVLALHATACVAGFIAGASLPLAAEDMTGFKRFIHEKAGPVAIGWVALVTTFSLVAQSIALGFYASTLSFQLDMPSWLLMLTVLPHALLELTAVFLPLAAWLIASRRGEWADLLAATFATVAIALPMLLVSAILELYLWPRLLEMASPALL